jgi:hypothetical protein
LSHGQDRREEASVPGESEEHLQEVYAPEEEKAAGDDVQKVPHHKHPVCADVKRGERLLELLPEEPHGLRVSLSSEQNQSVAVTHPVPLDAPSGEQTVHLHSQILPFAETALVDDHTVQGQKEQVRPTRPLQVHLIDRPQLALPEAVHGSAVGAEQAQAPAAAAPTQVRKVRPQQVRQVQDGAVSTAPRQDGRAGQEVRPGELEGVRARPAPETLLRFDKILRSGGNDLEMRDARRYFDTLDKKKKTTKRRKCKCGDKCGVDLLWLKNEINETADAIVEYFQKEPLYMLNFTEMVMSDEILDWLERRKVIKVRCRSTRNVYKRSVVNICDKMVTWIDKLNYFVDLQALDSKEQLAFTNKSAETLSDEEEEEEEEEVGEGECEDEGEYGEGEDEGERDNWVHLFAKNFDDDDDVPGSSSGEESDDDVVEGKEWQVERPRNSERTSRGYITDDDDSSYGDAIETL